MNATTRRIAGPVLGLLLAVTGGAAPAQAATASVSSAAATTWAQVMRRKLDLSTEAARRTVQLPGLRTAATARNAELAKARTAQTAAASVLATATAADQSARAAYVSARTAAAVATKGVPVAMKKRPYSVSRLIAAKRAMNRANALVQKRAATLARAATVFSAARTVSTAATGQLTAATTAYQVAGKAYTDSQQRIAAIPGIVTGLAARAVAVREQVVTQTRASFTVAATTKVYGVTVNKTVAYPFQRMVDDAAKAGVPLSGGGFRTQQQQIALRTTNGCPNVWTAPASSCRVPTAIPGRSLHELGLAIDMTSGGRSISDRKSKAFKWMAAHAGTYGFVNLPSEPWHWSITGS